VFCVEQYDVTKAADADVLNSDAVRAAKAAKVDANLGPMLANVCCVWFQFRW
jgi:hypothetical protein